MTSTITRTLLRTSRLLDFCSEKELAAQTGHGREDWPLVVLKELIDNALDACEEADAEPDIKVTVDDAGITIEDNGPCIAREVVAGVLDFSSRMSSREAYVAPDRGAQGNALKTVLAMPFVLDSDRGTLTIDSQGQKHALDVRVDRIRQEPKIDHRVEPGNVRIGTRVLVSWPDSALSDLANSEARFLQLARDYCFLNPHLALLIRWFGHPPVKIDATNSAWSKWRPNQPTSSHWYEINHFERLLAGYIAHDLDHGVDRNVRDVIREFDGLTGTAMPKAVLTASGFSRTKLSSLVNGDSLHRETVQRLLAAMHEHSKPVKPARLGLIAREHVMRRFEDAGCEMDTFQYRKELGESNNGLPYVIETAFAAHEDALVQLDDGPKRRMIAGVNWSPGIVNPFHTMGEVGESLDSVLAQQRADWSEPVVFLLHCASPRVRYLDRGKSSIALGDWLHMDAAKIIRAVESVTKKWAKQRKREERQRSARLSRRDHLRSSRITIKDVAWQVMEEAYMKASGDGKYPAHARQIMYAARPEILAKAGVDSLDDAYFTQTLLPDFLAEHDYEWDVVYDSRGSLIEPHTRRKVALGTLDVRRYLSQCELPSKGDDLGFDEDQRRFPTIGPEHRYASLLFVEKEGFLPLLERVQLAERYDLAIMSSKGMPSTSARSLVDEFCTGKLPLYVLHDFDKAGFSILGTLHRDTRRFAFSDDVNVIDLGIRLGDVEKYGLVSEPCRIRNSWDAEYNLAENGATAEEIEYLCGGQRVELNAFTSGDFVECVEAGLQKHGATKVVPNDDRLASAFRRAAKIEAIQRHIDTIERELSGETVGATVPTTLRRDVRKLLSQRPSMSWDAAVMRIVQKANSGRNKSKRGDRR